MGPITGLDVSIVSLKYFAKHYTVICLKFYLSKVITLDRLIAVNEKNYSFYLCALCKENETKF